MEILHSVRAIHNRRLRQMDDDNHEDNKELFKINQRNEYIDLVNNKTWWRCGQTAASHDTHVLSKTGNYLPNSLLGL